MTKAVLSGSVVASGTVQTALPELRERAGMLRRELVRVERQISIQEAMEWAEHRKQRRAAIEAMDADKKASTLGCGGEA